VPGQQQRRHLIANLPGGELRLRRQQVQYRSRLKLTGPAAADEVVDDVLELSLG
jgi:hypothetical protein